MSDTFHARKVRLAPVLMIAIFALASLKAAGLWLNFTPAAAEGETVEASFTPTPLASRRSETEERLLGQLSLRTAELDAREAELDTRESVIAAAELRVEMAMQAIAEEKQSIVLARGDRARERSDEIGALSNAYERMKPRDAARIFEVLDDDILIPVAAGMRTQSLAGVLAEMSASRAKTLTIALANRETTRPLNPEAPAVAAPVAKIFTPKPALSPLPASMPAFAPEMMPEAAPELNPEVSPEAPVESAPELQ